MSGKVTAADNDDAPFLLALQRRLWPLAGLALALLVTVAWIRALAYAARRCIAHAPFGAAFEVVCNLPNFNFVDASKDSGQLAFRSTSMLVVVYDDVG